MAGDQNDLPKYHALLPRTALSNSRTVLNLPAKKGRPPITIPKLAFFRSSWIKKNTPIHPWLHQKLVRFFVLSGSLLYIFFFEGWDSQPRSSFDLDLRGLLRQKRTSKRTTRNSGIGAEVSQDKQLSEKLLPNLHAACESVEAGRVGVELVEWPSETGWHTCSFTCWIRRVGPSQLIDHGKTLEILANNSVAGLIESDDERDWQTTCLWVGLIQCYDILNPAYSIRDFIYIGGLTCQNSYSSCWIARPPDGGVPAECFMAHSRNWYLPIRSNVVMASVLRSNDDRKHSCWAVYPSI